jgi:uncharacterized lipoprotein YddW (UPF0748 family)
MTLGWTRQRRWAGGLCALAASGLLPALAMNAPAQEFRALWVDAFNPGFRSASEVSQLVADARTGNCNAVVVEVRKRGDAYYNSHYEPKATNVWPQSYDPLADLCAKAHNTNNGPRVEVHAWIVTYPIWNNSDTNAAPTNHPVRLHLDWLSETEGGTQFSGNYVFDPGHPGVQQHTFNVAMDIITNYDVDGLNFDYIRYFDSTWGYNDVAIARFNLRYGRSGRPASGDALWKQFRRDQVTALVRKVYLSAIAVNPQVKITVDTIGGYPGVTTDADFVNRSQAYKDRLQDWRAWMEEGILDMNILMAYFNQAGQYAPDWTNWNAYVKDRRYNRHSVVGPGIYLNSMANALFQMRYTRRPSLAGNYADGVCGYSYNQPTSDGTPRATFLAALTSTNTSWRFETNPVPLFATPATPPPMPWKTTPTKGHLKGFVCGGTTSNPLDGATVTLTGPVNRTQMSDATGFYGFVDLVPGTYSVAATMPGLGAGTNAATVAVGAVTTVNLLIGTNDTTAPVISNVAAINVSDASATITWTTDEPADSVVESGPTTGYGTSVTNTALVQSHSLTLPGLNANSPYHYRVKSKDAASNRATSADFAFATLPAGAVSDLIIDDAAATVVGSWTSSAAYPGYYGTGYRYRGSGSGSQYVEFRPNIPVAGTYRVYTWYVQGGNRTTDGPHLIADRDGSHTVDVNQQINGSQWFLLGSFNFAVGTGGYVRITDAFTPGGVVMADAVKFVFVPAPPVITAQPQSQTVKAGSNATFTVTATGTAPLAYQWRGNGVPVAGATASSYSLVAGRTNDASPYSVIVSNVAGAVVSSNALLTVLPPAPARFQSITRLPSGRLSLVISGDPGVSGSLDSSTNLSDWLPLAGFFNTNGLFEFIDPAAANSSQRFYRTRQ